MSRISVERLALEHAEADDDVRHLDAGVVDVVLDLHRDAAEAEDADQRVAERGVAQVADVRRLVRVDRRVLDDRLAGARARCGRRPGARRSSRKRRPLEKDIQVAVGRGGDPGNAFERAERAGNLLGDRAWRLAQAARQLERDRRAEVAQLAVRRVLERRWRAVAGLV